MLQKNVLDYLDSSAARFPHKLAFADEARSFTFGQLRACARGLGTALADLGPQHNRPVAVLVNHTAANLAAFFGVLEAGHFYVPLDLQMPLPRLRGILETLSPAALVYPAGEETLAQALADLCPVLCAEEGFAHPPQDALLDARRGRVLDIDPVYAIFTSGSTGTPKGIVIAHRSVIDFTEWMADACQFTHQDVMGNQAPFYFDLSVKDIYLTLKCGATTHIIPKKDFLFPTLLMDFLAYCHSGWRGPSGQAAQPLAGRPAGGAVHQPVRPHGSHCGLYLVPHPAGIRRRRENSHRPGLRQQRGLSPG